MEGCPLAWLPVAQVTRAEPPPNTASGAGQLGGAGLDGVPAGHLAEGHATCLLQQRALRPGPRQTEPLPGFSSASWWAGEPRGVARVS